MDLIIPVFNRLEYTQVCLESLLSVDHGVLKLRPIIVDNGSRQRTRQFLEQWVQRSKSSRLDQALLITMPTNVGYAAAVNEAIKASPEGEYVFLMHNDCVPFDGWADELIWCLNEHAKDDAIAAVPRTSYANETGICVLDLRKAFEAIKPPNKDAIRVEDIRLMLERLYPDKGKVLGELKVASRTSYMPEISSFCMAVQKPLLVRHPFDEEFWPRFFEDKYWFLEYERQGCVCMASNWSYVHHFGNITTDGPGFCMIDLFIANQEKFKNKVKIMNEKPSHGK